MRIHTALSLLLATVSLAACGGGSSPASTPLPPPSGPAPTPAPTPTPTNTTINNLVASQTFSTLSSGSQFRLVLSDAEVLATSLDDSPVTIAFDTASNRYTVSREDLSEVFRPADLVQDPGLENSQQYRIGSGNTSSLLTLGLPTPASGLANQYVARGQWQRNTLTATEQDTGFDSFVYGFAASPSVMPVSGLGSYAIDIFGALTVAGTEARALAGDGLLELDFGVGAWRIRTRLAEYDLASLDFLIGGTLEFMADGTLGSDTRLAGLFSYSNQARDLVSGQVSGQFYGPEGQEFGGAFSGDAGTGAVLNGTIIGRRTTSAEAKPLALTNIIGETQLPAYFSAASGLIDESIEPAFRGFQGNTPLDRARASVTYNDDDTISLRLNFFYNVLLAPDAITSNPGGAFDVYETSTVGTANTEALPVRVSLLKPGPANPEIALTYASFAIWEQEIANPGTLQQIRQYYAFGFETPRGHLNTLSGTATYSGIARGATTNAAGQVIDVEGTSRFVFDFTADTYSGALQLAANDGGAVIDLGEFGFASSLINGLPQPANFAFDGTLSESSRGANAIFPVLYGPAGQELLAPFSILVGEPFGIGQSTITGVAAAKVD